MELRKQPGFDPRPIIQVLAPDPGGVKRWMDAGTADVPFGQGLKKGANKQVFAPGVMPTVTTKKVPPRRR